MAMAKFIRIGVHPELAQYLILNDKRYLFEVLTPFDLDTISASDTDVEVLSYRSKASANTTGIN